MSEETITISELFVDLDDARKHLEEVRAMNSQDSVTILEMEKKSQDRLNDALNVFNGIANRIDRILAKMKAEAPAMTTWAESKEG